MTILAVLIRGLITALVMSIDGDNSGLVMVAEFIIGAVMVGFVLWFLSVSGWAGLLLICLIGLAMPMLQALFKD